VSGTARHLTERFQIWSATSRLTLKLVCAAAETREFGCRSRGLAWSIDDHRV